MTDEEMKRLEGVARAVADGKRAGWTSGPAEARDILALIQRVRDAEAAVDSALGDMSADLRDAERRGAAVERQRWMNAGRAIVGPLPGDAS